MDAALESTMLRSSPFLDAKGGIDVGGLCSLLEFDQTTLANALGVSRQAVSQQLREKAKFIQPRTEAARQFWNELNEVVTLLMALTDESNTEEEIRRWLHSPNKALRVKRPIDLIKQRKLTPLKEALMDALLAAQGG